MIHIEGGKIHIEGDFVQILKDCRNLYTALESLAELKDFAAKELETVTDAADGEENTYATGVLKGTEHLKEYIDRAYTYDETGGKPCD